MKKIILTVLCGLLFTVASKAQENNLVITNDLSRIDLLEKTIDSNKEHIKNINLRLDCFTKKYYTGVGIIMGGTLITGFGVLGYAVNPDNATGNGVVMVMGGLLTTIGTFKVILSHKTLKSNFNLKRKRNDN